MVSAIVSYIIFLVDDFRKFISCGSFLMKYVVYMVGAGNSPGGISCTFRKESIVHQQRGCDCKTE